MSAIVYQAPPEPQGLQWARDALFSWLLARRRERPFHLLASTQQQQDLSWLGLEWSPGEEGEAPPQFPTLEGSDDLSLGQLREKGYLAEALLASLSECSWQAPRGGRLLTRIELLLYFSEEGLKAGPVTFDREFLEEAQSFFMEELTPRELLQRSNLPRELAPEEQEELEGIALLLGEEVANLAEFRERLAFYFQPPNSLQRTAHPGLSQFESLQKWNSKSLEAVVEQLPQEQLESLQERVFGRREVHPTYLLALLGRPKVIARLKGG